MEFNFDSESNYLYSPNWVKHKKNRFSAYNIPIDWAKTAMGLKLVEILVNDYTDLPAYKMGLINENGSKIREPQTPEEKDQYNYFVKVALSLKTLMQKRMSDTAIKKITHPLLLIRENKEDITNNLEIFFNELHKLNDNEINNFITEETFSGSISSTGGGFRSIEDTYDRNSKMFKKLMKKQKRKHKKINEFFKKMFKEVISN